MKRGWIPASQPPKDDKPVIVAHYFHSDSILGRDANGWHAWIAKYDGEKWLRADGFLLPDTPLSATVLYWRPFPSTKKLQPTSV